MYLVLGEKPSVARAYAKVLGADKQRGGYLEGHNVIVSWCLGHLAEYVPPEVYDEHYRKWEFDDLPIVPEKWQLAVTEGKKKQFEVLKKLLNRSDLEYVVNGCDAGREGELIFRHVYDLSGSRLPVKRLWVSSMEESAIREGFSHLVDGKEYENLCAAAVCRSKADWLVGMNATRAFTTKYYKRLVVGRVQTPTLALLVERQRRISDFTREAYYKVTLKGNGLAAVSDSIQDEPQCDEIVEKCNGHAAIVSRVETLRRRTSPPKLYDLTTLQREANRYHGYTAQETLQGLQELYEAKLVTYPRTDSRYVTEDMAQTVRSLLGKLPGFLHYEPLPGMAQDIGRITDDSKVTDHHALLPTLEGLGSDRNDLSEVKNNLLKMICHRLVLAVAPDCIYDEIKVEILCEGSRFHAGTKKILEMGFRDLESSFSGKRTDEDLAGELGDLYEGMSIPYVKAEKNQFFSSPPSPYTEDTLLSAMENAGCGEFKKDTEKKGLGTPATRAGIIEKLVSSGYAARKGKQILPTEEGTALVSVMPENLKSATMTAEWENKLLQIERGQLRAEEFLEEITAGMVKQVIADCRAIPAEERHRFHPREEIGTCPVCHSPVYEGKKNFYCSSCKCSFVLWKDPRYLSGMRKQIDKGMARELLSVGRTHVTDLYSKKKKRNFEADLLMEVDDGRAVFKLEFPAKNKSKPPRV